MNQQITDPKLTFHSHPISDEIADGYFVTSDGYIAKNSTIIDIEKGINPGREVECEIKYVDGMVKKINLLSRIDTANEVEYYKNDGILKYVLRSML